MIQPTSFLLGLGAAYLVPFVARAFRPLAVQATVAGMGIFDEVRRAVAEQAEMLEDIAAEARARREEMTAAETEEGAESETTDAPITDRRRRNGASRRKVS